MFLYYPMCLPHTPFTTTPAEPSVTGNLERHRAMVRYADQLVGRLVDALDELGLRQDTLVVVTTDNGTVGNITGTRLGRKVKGGKSNTTEPGICVPLIVNGPGRVAAGKTSAALLSIADFLPTFAELAETQPQPGYTYDGRAAVAALLGREDRSPHSWILAMGGKNDARLTRDGVQNAWIYRDRVLRDERFKLHVDTRRQLTALYDLAEDPGEERNLIASQDPVVAAARARLSAPLAGFPERDRDPIYTPLPPQPWDVKITAESQVWKK
jgi:arylsulfatase A-like enzyme